MKKKVFKSHKSKIFNYLNIILIALVLIEVAFVVNQGVLTGNPVKVVSEADEEAAINNIQDNLVGQNQPTDKPPTLFKFNRQRSGSDGFNAQGLSMKTGSNIVPSYSGYLIEFPEDPAVAYHVKKQKEGYSKDALKQDVNNYGNELIRKQEVKEDIIKDISSKVIVKKRYTSVFNGFLLEASEKEIEQIKKNMPDARIYKNYEVYATLMDSVPLIGANDVWQMRDSGGMQITGEGITIGIIDTGVDYTHPDLGGCFGSGCKVVGGYDFINYDEDPMDDMGHGTHVAATAAGEGTLNGVAPGATIYSYKVLDSYGGGSDASVIFGIDASTDPNGDGDFSDHLDIISLSLGGYGDSDDPMAQAVDNAVNLGVIAVIAAGNSGPEGDSQSRHSEDPTGASYSIGSPGTARKAITVAASNKNDVIAGFSSRGPTINGVAKPDITAPGVSICAAQYDSAWEYNSCFDEVHTAISGTSMATPHIAGAVALIKQAYPGLTPDEIKSKIMDNAIDLGYDPYTQGAGRVDVFEAINIPSITHIKAKINSLQEVEGVVDITGTANGTSFSYYTLEQGIGFNPNSWNLLVNSNNPVSNGVIYSLNTIELTEGLHSLRLKVFDTDNNFISSKEMILINNLKTIIASPKDSGILGKEFSIMGTASATNFVNYKISYSSDLNVWNGQGITLVNNGNSQVVGGILATFNTMDLSSGYYHLKLIVTSQNQEETFYVNNIYIDPEIKKGFPVKLNGLVNKPTIYDLDKDGDLEILATSLSWGWSNIFTPFLFVINSDGTQFNGFPRNWIEQNFYVTPSVYDLDKDGEEEIFLGSTAYEYGNILNDGGLYVVPSLTHPEQFKWLLPLKHSTMSTPVIANIKGNSDPEVVIGTGLYDNWGRGGASGSEIYMFELENGSNLKISDGWPINFSNDTFHALTPVIADLNRDGKNELIFNTIYDVTLNSNWNDWKGRVYALDSNGSILPGWPNDVYGFFDGQSATVANLDEDADLEILVVDNSMVAGYFTNSSLYIFNYNGSIEKSWRIADSFFSPLIADLDKNNNLEIIIGGFRNLSVYSKDGTLLKSTNGVYYFSEPVAYDLLGDDNLEIIVGSWDGYVHIFYSNLSEYVERGWPKFLGYDESGWVERALIPPAVADLDNDGYSEVIYGTESTGMLYVWEIKEKKNSQRPAMFHYNAQHTGVYQKPYACADLNSDGVRDILDVTLLINHAFRNGPEPQPKWIGDLDANNVIDIMDVILMINHAFRNGPVPTCTAVANTTTSSSATGTLSISQGTPNTDGTTNILVYSNTPTSIAGEQFKLSYSSDISITSITTSTGMDIYRKPVAGPATGGKVETIDIISSSGSKTIKGNTLLLTIKAKNTKKDYSSMKLQNPIVIDWATSTTYKTVNVQNTIQPPSTKPTCTDSDKGKTYNTKGTLTVTNSSGTFNYQDACTSSSKLKEFYCNNNQAAFISYTCPYGCLDGKCKVQEKVVKTCTKGKLVCTIGKFFGYYQK